MKKVRILINVLISLPKTIYFNFQNFDLKTAVKLPVLITNNVKILEIHKNSLVINKREIKPFMIKIGISGSEAINSNKEKIFISKNSKIIFNGCARFAEGIVLYNNGGITEFGNNFISNKNCFIACDLSVKFGDDVLLGWNINIRDSDGHTIIYNSIKKGTLAPVEIGNHVWICSNVNILKNNYVGKNSVIGYNSCLAGINTADNTLIAGYPAKVIKTNINWEK